MSEMQKIEAAWSQFIETGIPEDMPSKHIHVTRKALIAGRASALCELDHAALNAPDVEKLRLAAEIVTGVLAARPDLRRNFLAMLRSQGTLEEAAQLPAEVTP